MSNSSTTESPAADTYPERLLAVYRDLKVQNLLLADLPLWAVDFMKTDAEQLANMKKMPRLQAALAGITAYTPSKWLLEQELSLRQSKPHETHPPAGTSWHPDSGKDVFIAAQQEQLRGLCFSGGGIRSATFCLGVLQALAECGKLGRFDYLSTVSGGGYIHEWFASWIRNEPDRFETVARRLKPLPEKGSQARAPEQITWLRRYSSYLTPQRGLFTADTWTLAAIWMRNTFLNQIVLFSFLASCLILVRAAAHSYLGTFNYRMNPFGRVWLLIVSSAVLLTCCHLLRDALYSQDQTPKDNGAESTPGALTNTGVNFLLVLPGFLVAILLSLESIGRIHGLSVLSCLRADLHNYHLWFQLNAHRCIHIGPAGWRTTVHKLLHLTFVWLRDAAYKIHPFNLAQPSRQYSAALFAVWTAYIFALLLAITFGSRAPYMVRELKGDLIALLYNFIHWISFKLKLLKPDEGWKPKTAPVASQRLALLGFVLAAIFCTTGVFATASYVAYAGHYDSDTRLQYLSGRIADAGDRLFEPAPAAPKIVLHQELTTGAGITNLSLQASAAIGDTSTPQHRFHKDVVYLLIAPVFFFALQFFAIRLQLGILGRYCSEVRREWLSRFGAWSAMLSTAWIGLGTIALIGPAIYDWFFYAPIPHKAPVFLAAIGTHAMTLYSGASSKTSGKPSQGSFLGYKPLDLVGIVGAPLCILILLVLCSGLLQTAIRHTGHWGHGYRWELAALTFGTFAFSGWRIDVNEFSMHGFYRNRLSRCYLGGTNPTRTPDPFTGFDDHTEATATTGMPLSKFLPKNFQHPGNVRNFKSANRKMKDIDGKPYDGPFPIFCSTLTLSFGEDLAYQERKGASFAFTPLYTGYHVGWTGAEGEDTKTTFNGYVPTAEYAYPDDGVRLSTVTAVCGAALSPNFGVSTQPALAFLMTLFNVRLGWWIANPRRKNVWPAEKMKPTPIFGPRYLLSELFGLSDDTSNYVSLCDGGRFENMGMYELVRRRCSLIVVCDAEGDSNTVFEGIGGAIAKCRTDFGAEITLNLHPMIPGEDGLSKLHLQVGTIRYPAPPGDTSGTEYLGRIVYLKTSITGDETGDLLHHLRTYPGFPQDSTLNQWFTESQFESYRRLGQLIGEQACPYIVDGPYINPEDAKSGSPKPATPYIDPQEGIVPPNPPIPAKVCRYPETPSD